MKELDALKSVLEAEREVLLRGHVSDIAPLTRQKIALLESLGPRVGKRGIPDDIKALANRNAALLEATARGIKSALTRVADIRSAMAPTTYDAKGGRQALSVPNPQRETRA